MGVGVVRCGSLATNSGYCTVRICRNLVGDHRNPHEFSINVVKITDEICSNIFSTLLIISFSKVIEYLKS